MRLGRYRWREQDLDARICPIDMFVQVRFNNPVIVQSETLAKRVLRNLESPIHIPPECRGEIEADREGEST